MTLKNILMTEWGIRLSQWKAYIDYGRGITSYFNELFLIFGTWSVVQAKSPKLLAIIFVGYAILTFIVGWAGYYFGAKEAEAEVQNRYNLFVKQMRKKVIYGKKS